MTEAATSAPLKILILFTVLTMLPGIVISMTAFLRIVLVLGFIRSAMGLQQVPPNQVIIGLSIFLTYFVMGSAMEHVYVDSIKPLMEDKIQPEEAYDRGVIPMKRFMLAQTRQEDLVLMSNLAKAGSYTNLNELPIRVLVPAFVISEMRAAFAIGFLLFIPFLIVDLSIAALLNALGMIMLPPTLISMPFKLLLFVLADGWAMIVGALVRSFGS